MLAGAPEGTLGDQGALGGAPKGQRMAEGGAQKGEFEKAAKGTRFFNQGSFFSGISQAFFRYLF